MKINVQIGNIAHGTKINEINVPEQMRKKIPTGIGFIDDCCGGMGFTPGTITLLTGTPGAGKSTLLFQLANAVSKKENCISLYNTTEESLFQSKITCERLFGSSGCDFYIGEDRIVDDREAHDKIKDDIAHGRVRAILQHARFLQSQNPGKQLFLFVDSLQTIDDGKYYDGTTNSNTPVRAMELLTNFVKETFAICVCIGQVNKSGEFAGKQAIKHTIDCHMHLRIDNKQGSETQGMRIFEMQKNRFGYSGLAYILNVEDNGLHEWGSIDA